MTIGRKILALAGILLALNLGLGLVALGYLSKLSAGTQQLAGRVSPSIYLAGRINTGAKAIIMRVYRHVSFGSPQQMDSFESYAADREKACARSCGAARRWLPPKKIVRRSIGSRGISTV